jgi:uncharacterized protein (TIGR02246 family)
LRKIRILEHRVENPEATATALQDAFNAGDLEGMVNQYEPEGIFISAPGQPAVGSDSLRETFAGFLASKPTFKLKVTSLHEVGDIALETSQWELVGTDSDGNPMALSGRCAATLRRQPDGHWLYVIDNPFPFERPPSPRGK